MRPWPCWCWYKTGKSIETLLILWYKSPSRVWYLDSYDKFKPFGFESKGCFDGDSWCILWLKILRSNKDQKEVCNIFVNYWLLLKEFHRESYWSCDGERSYNRFSKIPQKESREWFSWTFRLFIREDWSSGCSFSKDLFTIANIATHEFLQVECFKFVFFSVT